MPLDNNTPETRNNVQPTHKNEAVIAAHEQADKDIAQDAELNPAPSAADDLDEGEMARFEGGESIEEMKDKDDDQP